MLIVFKYTFVFSRGHGTYVDEDKLTASVAGEVQRVDKLICVRPLKTRYVTEMKLFNSSQVDIQTYTQILNGFMKLCICRGCVFVILLLKCRFNGEVGDVVVGRITEVRHCLLM